MTEKPTKSGSVFNLKALIDLWIRVLALIFLCFTIKYWMLTVGLYDQAVRFDVMATYWKVATAVLSVCYPIAALSLWGLYRWGFVMWFITASTELVMHLVYPDLFGQAISLVVFHIVCLLIWVLYLLIQYLDERREQLNKA